MTLYDFLQTKTYSTNVAATSHALTLDNAVRSMGGSIGPSTLIATLSYDGNTGNRCSSITDTDGNTWTKGTSASNSAGVNGEMWYAYNVVGGNTPTITVNMDASVKLSMVVVEVDQVKPIDPLDQTTARVDSTASTTLRKSALTNTTLREGACEVTIGGLAWNQSGWTTSTPMTGFTDLTVIQDGSSNIGAAMNHRSVENGIVAGSLSISHFLMSSASSYPAAVMCLSFLRDGVVTASEDGYIDNIEGTPTAYTTSPCLVYRSSLSAPVGGTGTSQRSTAYAFFPVYDGLLAGATIGEAITLTYYVDDGYDDGTNEYYFRFWTSKTGDAAPTLTASDDYDVNDRSYDIGLDPTNAGTSQTVALTKTLDYNESGYTSVMMSMETHEQEPGPGGIYSYLKERSYGAGAMWLELQITYPSGAPFPHINGGYYPTEG